MYPYYPPCTTAAAAPTPPAMQPPGAPPAPPTAVAPVPHHSPILPPEEVRKIFISGLPDNVKGRELLNMLRWLPVYLASQVNYKGEKPMGFDLFSTPPFAVDAKDNLQGLLFDVDMHSVLHTEMAKKNLFVKSGIVLKSGGYDQSKRMQTGGDYIHPAYVSPSLFHPPPAPVWGPHGYMAPPPPPYDLYAGCPVAPVPPVPMVAPSPVLAPSSYLPVQNIKDNKDELRGLFSVQPGFKQMKVLRQERHTVCFIEYEDVSVATNVHHTLQVVVIPSSGSVGMQIQYSKTLWEKEGWSPSCCGPWCESRQQ